MCKKKIFGKVVIIGFLGLIMAQLIGKGINYFTGWSELQNINSMNLNGLVNKMIFTQWHIPNHGMSRVAGTLILSIVYAWLALKYTFFAPLIMHYIFDSIIVISMGNMNGISQNEVFWLSHNCGILNTSFTIGIIVLLIYIVFIFISNMRKIRNLDKMNYSS
ncbi:CPBP family intramembrane metalloprotease [Clostridium sp. CM028]|nr:CPBP family glutamic-type intramembrane protease [Clostridium sp. CM028]MBW9150235.1 CPBP family intramembrane metalloprotease [Clostridium sp. CM028]WLC63471.1 CPBP family intramembrane metalloprotease [Clostridium sp. CM028]